MNSTTKLCKGKHGCNKSLDTKLFGTDSRNKDGYKSLCKICEKKYKHNYYLKHKDMNALCVINNKLEDTVVYVCFKNTLDEESPIYTQISGKNKLLHVVREFTRTSSNEVRTAIVEHKVKLYVNDVLIEVDDWHTCILKTDDRVVIIPGIGATMAAVFVAGTLLSLTVGTLSYAVVYAIVYIAVSLAMSWLLGMVSSWLFEPDLPTGGGGGGSGKATQSYSWSGIKTTARPDQGIPVLYGTHKLGGNVISVFTDNEGTDNYLYMLLGLCEGEIDGICHADNYASVCITSDTSNSRYAIPAIKINEQPFDTYSDVEWWYRTGKNTSLCENVWSNTTPYIIGDVVYRSTTIYTCIVAHTGKEPNVATDWTDYWQIESKYPFCQQVVPWFDNVRLQYDDSREINVVGIVYTTTTSVDMVSVKVQAPQLYRSDTEGIHGIGVSFRISYRLASTAPSGAWYHFKDITLSAKSKTPIWSNEILDFRILKNAGTAGTYQIKINRTDGGKSTSLNVSNNLVLSAITEITDGKFIYPNTTLLGLRMKATGQLSGNLPNITTIIRGEKVNVPSLSGTEPFDDVYYNASLSRWETDTGLERTWDESTFEEEFSNNAMLCVRDLLLKSRYGLGNYIDSTDLYTSGIVTTIKQCHTAYTPNNTATYHYHTFDGVLEGEQSALTTLVEMCNIFRAWPIWVGGEFNFVLDTDDTPIHTITTSNMIEFQQTFTPLSEVPYKVYAQFTDYDNDWELRALIGRSTDTTLTKLNERTIGLKGITNKHKAERELIYKLNKVTNCTHHVGFKTGIDYIHATAGDIVYIQHDLPSWGNSGRILDYNSTTASLVFQQSVTFDSLTASYLVQYNTAENDFVTATIDVTATGSYQTVELKTFPSVHPTIGGIYAVGESPGFVKKFRILSTQRTKDDEVECMAVEHLSSLYAGEPTVMVIDDDFPENPNPSNLPGAPREIHIANLHFTEGIGFVINALPPTDEINIREIVVEMTDTDDSYYKIIGTIQTSETELKYIDNNLALNNTYYFRVYCRTWQNKKGPVVTTSYFLPKSQYVMQPPSGIHIKGADPNTQTFPGKEVCIQWNPVGAGTFISEIVKGYVIEIYHTSISTANKLRTVYTTENEYTYTWENNLEDSGATYPYGVIIFKLYTKTTNEVLSASSIPFVATNTTPNAVTSLSGTAWMVGAKFEWDHNIEPDLSHYLHRLKVEDGSWSAWIETSANMVIRTLTQAEKTANPSGATIYIEVKVVDVFQNVSSTQDTSAESESLNIVSADIDNFAIGASKIFTKIPILSGDSWSHNSPSAGDIAWNEHNLYYNGTLCVVNASHTDNKYVYWENNATAYSATNVNPVLDDDDFIISTNVNGYYDLAWNAIANQVIGAAYIQDAAIKTAKIEDLAVTDAKINSLNASKIVAAQLSAISADMGTITAGNITIDSSGFIRSEGKNNYNSATSGFFLGYDMTDYKFNIGDTTEYIKWDGAEIQLKGDINAVSGDFSGDVTLGSNNNVLIKGSDNAILVFGDTVRVTASLNDFLDWTENATTYSCQLDATVCSPPTLAADAQTKMRAEGSNDTTVTYNATTRFVTIANPTLTTLSLLWNTGGNTGTSCANLFGFDASSDDVGATRYTSDEGIGLRVRLGKLI